VGVKHTLTLEIAGTKFKLVADALMRGRRIETDAFVE